MRKLLWIILIVMMSSCSFTIHLGPNLQSNAMQSQNLVAITEEVEVIKDKEEEELKFE